MQTRRMDYHLHTFFSPDGRQTLRQLCARMVEQGVEEIALTDHYEKDYSIDPMYNVPIDWQRYFSDIEACRRQFPSLTIRAGLEIGDHMEVRDAIKREINALPLDFRLLSLHLVEGYDPYDQRFFQGKTMQQAWRAGAEAKAESVLAWDDFDSVAHIGYVAKFAPYGQPITWQDAPDAFDAILKHVADHGAAIEINTSGYKNTGEPMAHPTLVKRFLELGGEKFTFGSDSHDVARDYADIERAKDMVRSLGGKWQVAFDRRKQIVYAI